MADGSHVPQIHITRAVRTRPKLVADLFCGAGGLSTGATRAFRDLRMPFKLVGVNHWPVAIETNKRNHAEHADRIHCADLESARPIQLVPEGYLDLLMAAPACTFHSRARGGKPVNDQQRMDPWHVVRWCTELRVKRILVENVPEFMDWGPCSLVTGRPIPSRKGEYFRAWIAALRSVGFRLDWRVLCAADYGDATTRRRFILIGRSDGKPLRWPEPTYAAEPSTDLLGTRKRWRAAADIIDWEREGASIFTRKRPLKPNTVRRILAGAVKYRWPAPYVQALQALLEGREPRLAFSRSEAMVHGLIAAGGRGFVLATASGGVARDLAQPLPTITTGGASGARPGCARPQLVEPLIVPVSNSSNKAPPWSTAEPIRTVTTAKGGDQALAVPLVAPYYGGGSGLTAAPVVEPIPSVTTKARFGLAEPFALPVTHHGDMRTHGLGGPLPTITGANRGELGLAAPFLVPNFGERDGQAPRTHGIDGPVPTVTASGHIQLAMPSAEIADEVRIDINYRMLHWRELARATSFDHGAELYDFAGTATEITKQIGNAVPCLMGQAAVGALMEDAA